MSMEITEQARDAAYSESNYSLSKRHPVGHFVQLAIDAACAEKDKEIERLNRLAELYNKDTHNVMAQRDTLAAELAELKEIAASLQLLEKCAEKVAILDFITLAKGPDGKWLVASCLAQAEADTLPLAIALFAKQLFKEETK